MSNFTRIAIMSTILKAASNRQDVRDALLDLAASFGINGNPDAEKEVWEWVNIAPSRPPLVL